MNKLFIEGFDGNYGRSQVYEVIEVDASGIEQVQHEVLFKDEPKLVASNRSTTRRGTTRATHRAG